MVIRYQLLSAKRWTKTHLQYPSAGNVISLCRWAVRPDKVEPLGKKRVTCTHCLKLIPFARMGIGDITKEYAERLLRRLKK